MAFTGGKDAFVRGILAYNNEEVTLADWMVSVDTAVDANVARTQQVSFQVAAEGSAGATLAESVIARIPVAGTVTGVTIVPTGAATADATNNATLTVGGRVAGGAAVTIATLITNVAGGSWAAFTDKAATLSGTPANLVITAGEVFTLTVAKGGTGVQLPSYLVTIQYTVA